MRDLIIALVFVLVIAAIMTGIARLITEDVSERLRPYAIGSISVFGTVAIIAALVMFAARSDEPPGDGAVAAVPSDVEIDQYRLAALEPPSASETITDTSFVELEVFFGTDRRPTGSSSPSDFFGRQRGSSLTVGSARISIPRRHRPGRLESPSWRRLDPIASPSRHVLLRQLSISDSLQWVQSFQSRLTGIDRSALVFVHGFNVSFEDAARRTAQLSFDLGFEGPAAFFSWPSKQAVASYTADEATVERSVPYLARFIQNFVVASGAKT